MNKFALISLLTVVLVFFNCTCLLAYESNVIVGFEVQGNQLIEEKIILLNIAEKIGDTLSAQAVQDDIARIGEMGYFSYVGAEVKTDGTGKKVVFNVEENAIVGDIVIKGCTKVKNDIYNIYIGFLILLTFSHISIFYYLYHIFYFFFPLTKIYSH